MALLNAKAVETIIKSFSPVKEHDYFLVGMRKKVDFPFLNDNIYALRHIPACTFKHFKEKLGYLEGFREVNAYIYI